MSLMPLPVEGVPDSDEYGNDMLPSERAQMYAHQPKVVREAPDTTNLVARRGFPHRKVHKRWKARIDFAKDSYKANLEDYRDALADLCGPDRAAAENATKGADKKFAAPIFVSDFLKIISFYNNQNPRTTCAPAKGQESKALAEATAMLSDRSAQEVGELDQDALTIAEGICRNHGYSKCGWDAYRWLPTFDHAGEVMLDPNCRGDMKRAKYVIEESEMSLSDMLEDATIPASIRKELRDKKGAHRSSRSLKENALSLSDSSRAHDVSHGWDDNADMAMLQVYRISSIVGVLPGEIEGVSDEEADVDDAPDEAANSDRLGSSSGGVREKFHSVHEQLVRPPPEIPEDSFPEAPNFDPLEHGRRVQILIVEGFDKVLKVTDWPLAHYDRDEFGFVEFRPIRIPDLLHGHNIYRMIRPYMKVINDCIEFWVASERRASKRIAEVDKNAIIDPAEREKIESDRMYEVVYVDHIGGVKLTDFQGRSASFKEMIPAFLKLHDDTTGINEAVSGRAPGHEETASAAQMRQDQAVAALAYLETAVQRFRENKARMRVAALQCYVSRENEYAPCVLCGGVGQGVDEGEVVVCPKCLGRGRKIVKRGAEFWLPPEQAMAWRDDLTLDEIRGEIIVGIQPGSSRADFQARRLSMLTVIADRYVPMLMQQAQGAGSPQAAQGVLSRAQAIIREHLLATEAPGALEFVPTLQELMAVVEGAQQAAAAAQQGAQKAGKSPEEIQATIAEGQHEMAMREREVGLEERKAEADVALRSSQVEAQHGQVEAQMMQAKLQAQSQREGQQMQFAPKPAPPMDPLKAADLEARTETERQKLALDAERVQIEREKMEMDAALRQQEAEAKEREQALVAAMQERIGALEERIAGLASKGKEASEKAPESA